MSPKLLYASFDVVPASKGAAVHIEQFAKIIASRVSALQLITVGEPSLFQNHEAFIHRQFAPGIEQFLIPAPGENFLDRINNFRRLMESFCKNRNYDIAHFRSPIEGLWLSKQKGKTVGALIFEVNGLPSIELKYRYPKVADDFVFLEKVFRQEQECLEAADLIVTTSEVTAKYLQTRSVEPEKLRVIPNAVDLSIFNYQSYKQLPSHSTTEPIQFLYFGTLSAWQGVELAISAISLINQVRPASLTIIGAGRAAQIDEIKNLIAKEGLTESVKIVTTVSQRELVDRIHDSQFVLAPLSANDRNTIQGCCPFKILEGMAAGRVVISSALPVVQELSGINNCVIKCKPGSAGAIRDAVFAMLETPGLIQDTAKAARERIETHYDLERSSHFLYQAYEDLLSK